MEYTAPSGAKVVATLADYSTGFDLLKAVLKAVRQGGIASKLPDTFNMTDILNADIRSMGGIADAVIDIVTSKDVEDILFKCMERATYELTPGNVEKISKATFEATERRGDYLPIAFEVAKFNVLPFIKDLPSLLKAVGGTRKSDSLS